MFRHGCSSNRERSASSFTTRGQARVQRCLFGLSLRALWSRELHAFDIHKLTNTELTQLSAIARALHSTEWKRRLRCDHAVDEYQPGLDFPNKLLALFCVFGPCRSSKAKRSAIRALDRCIDRINLPYGCNRPEQFLGLSSRAG